MADRLAGLTEETWAIAKRIETKPIVWVAKSSTDALGFKGKAQSLNCVALWQQYHILLGKPIKRSTFNTDG